MRVGVKICGLCREDDVRAAIAAGTDAVGFVLAASPRRVSIDLARTLATLVPPGILRVGVFGPDDADPEGIAPRQTLAHLFDLLQVEARHANAFATAGLPLLPVLRATGGAVVIPGLPQRVPSPLTGSGLCAPRFIVEGARSGRGERADWSAAAEVARREPIALAGGLSPENVADAIAAVRPAWVDVSSGIESAPARKEPARIEAFVTAARCAPPPFPIRPPEHS